MKCIQTANFLDLVSGHATQVNRFAQMSQPVGVAPSSSSHPSNQPSGIDPSESSTTPYTPQVKGVPVNPEDKVFDRVKREEPHHRWTGAELSNTGSMEGNDQALAAVIQEEIESNSGDFEIAESVGGDASEHFGMPVTEPEGRVYDHPEKKIPVLLLNFADGLNLTGMHPVDLYNTLLTAGLPDSIYGQAGIDDHDDNQSRHANFSASLHRVKQRGPNLFAFYSVSIDDD